jgi:esterase
MSFLIAAISPPCVRTKNWSISSIQRCHTSFFSKVSSRCFSTVSFDQPMKLQTEWLSPVKQMGKTNDHQTTNKNNNRYSILFLHGLLGNGRNLKTFARKIVEQRSPFCHGGILMDLRGHGKSYTNALRMEQQEHQQHQQKRPLTFQQCVQDVVHTLRLLHQEQITDNALTTTLVGHSFGGRLALEYAALSVTNGTPLQALWLLDTVPGQAHESVDKVIEAVSIIVKEGKDIHRKELVQVLMKRHGLDLGLAQWLSSSYNDKTRSFGFDLDLVRDLKPEFASQDFVGHLRKILEASINSCGESTNVHLVRGGKNLAWSTQVITELENLSHEYPKSFHLHVLPNAGHWLHVDDLPGLVGLFDKHA